MSEMNPDLPPYKIAFIIDNEVVDILHTDNRLAAIMLSEPTIIDATELYLNGQIVVGSTLNPDGSYTPPPPPDYSVVDTPPQIG